MIKPFSILCVLHHPRLACDRALIGQLKGRTLGNGVSRLRASLVEQHSRDWMARAIGYMSVLRKLRGPGVAAQGDVSLPAFVKVPGLTWFGRVYVLEAMTRLEETKARVTSIFGEILKMDSTKKVRRLSPPPRLRTLRPLCLNVCVCVCVCVCVLQVAKKLAGAAAGSAAWMSNVGNEYGQVLVSVLTAAEGDGLTNMAAGLMRRYREAGKAPPKVLYVDRDCCAAAGKSSVHRMFHEWRELVVRLDVWHLMRRFARGVTTDSHQLYGLFMARLSFAVFEWDGEDVARLKEAKRSSEGGRDAQEVRLSAKELARHCRRRTRGAPETERLLREVLDAYWEVTDSMGVPLIDGARMEEIWQTQRRHLGCIQDPEGVQLYTKTGEVTKGGVRLPVFRCARGSTSLESFHLHQCRFVPGNSLCRVCALFIDVFLTMSLTLSSSLVFYVQGAPLVTSTIRCSCWRAWRGGTRTVAGRRSREDRERRCGATAPSCSTVSTGWLWRWGSSRWTTSPSRGSTRVRRE